jgi:hypothetical protein
MNRHMMLVGRTAGCGAFKGAALVGALFIIVAAWWWDASLLTAAADENLQLLKLITGVLPIDWASKAESALRLFGADRALLLVEGITLAKLVMLGIAHPFRRRP